MGFELRIVVSSAVSPETRRSILDAAAVHWPHIRRPQDGKSYEDRAIFALPEMTSYLHKTPEDSSRVISQNFGVHDGLAEWSRRFPDVVFAFIEVDCFGGQCLYEGFCCQAGEVTLTAPRNPGGSLLGLLAAVGIELESLYFEPFVRGYFAGLGSGSFE